MRAIALVLVLACSAAAAEGDAPRIVKLRGGEGVKTAGPPIEELVLEPDSCYFSKEACVGNGKKLADLRARVDALEKSQGVPLPAVIGIILGAIAGGIAVGRLTK